MEENKVIQFATGKIVVDRVKIDRRLTNEGLIQPAKEKVEFEIAPEHSAEPIKNLADIVRIRDYLIGNNRYRDNMLFILGINFGLRVSDLRVLRFANLMGMKDGDIYFKDRFPVFEKKTRNTRKRKKNRYITINDAVIEAVTLYLKHTPNVSLSDYLFTSASRNSKNVETPTPLTARSINRMFEQLCIDLQLGIRFSTHTLRKTFCYHQMLISHNDPRKLLLLQKMLGHASMSQTLDYIGITEEEMDDAYRELNLGLEKGLIDSGIEEDVG